MISSFRRLSKSKIGTGMIATSFILILAGFAIGDISNFGTGNIGFGMGSSTLAEVGDQEVTEREMSDAMQRRLQDIRRERPEASYASIAADFETILGALIDQRTLIAFADKFGFHLSKRLIDAEIAQIPAAKGLNGQFNQQAYQAFLAQQRLTDGEVRQLIAGGLLQRLLLTPVATNARIPVGMARPYAAMLLESREGQVAAVPIEAFRAGLKPSDAQLQAYYAANKRRYMVPEQRVIRVARIGPEQVAGVTPTDQEIAAYYNANKDSYAAKETRSLTQVVTADQATANAIAARAKGGATIAAAAAPAGGNAAVSTLKDEARAAYADAVGEQAAAAVFAAAQGAVVGPVKGDFGWVVAKIDGASTQPGRTLEQARAEIAAKLASDKRKEALEDLVDKIQNAVDEGSNFTEAAAAAKVPVSQTPLVTAAGTSLAQPGYKLPAELAPALKTAFDIAPNDPPELVELANDRGYALVAPADVISSAPAPLASIREQVASDWIGEQAEKRARAVAEAIAARAASGVPFAQAASQANAPVPPVQPISARRIQIATAKEPVPPALQVLFTLAEGKSRMVADPQRRAFYVVRLNKITPGNPLLQPGLISEMQQELQQSAEQDYAQQFIAALRKSMDVERNEEAIRALKARLATAS